MNRAQRSVLFVGAGLILLAVLFPPWVYSWKADRLPGGFAPIFSPPSQLDAAWAFERGVSYGGLSVRMDGVRLTAELAGISLVSLALVLALAKPERRPPAGPSPVPPPTRT